MNRHIHIAVVAFQLLHRLGYKLVVGMALEENVLCDPARGEFSSASVTG